MSNKEVAACYGKRGNRYIFCSDDKILEVNRQYLQHDYYTDIITFDYCEGNRISGDFYSSLGYCPQQCRQFRQIPTNRKLHRVIIHGIPALVRRQRTKAPVNGDYGSRRKQSAGIDFPITGHTRQNEPIKATGIVRRNDCP